MTASPAPARLSIIVPTLNEAAGIARTLTALKPLRERGTQVIVADGGSRDGTAALAAGHADLVLRCPPARPRLADERRCSRGARRHGVIVLVVQIGALLAENTFPDKHLRLIYIPLGAQFATG